MTVTTPPLSAARTADAVRDGSGGALELLDAAFDRIADKDSSIRAFTTLLRADGRAAAARGGSRSGADRAARPLAGGPRAVESAVTLDNPASRPDRQSTRRPSR